MFDNTVKFEDVDAYELEFEHYSDLQAEMGYETVWSIDGIMPLEQKIFTDKQRLVTYKCIKSMSNSGHGVEWETFCCIAENGTVGELWKAAESCYKQAKSALGDWHIYIENFELQDDGSLELVTGS